MGYLSMLSRFMTCEREIGTSVDLMSAERSCATKPWTTVTAKTPSSLLLAQGGHSRSRCGAKTASRANHVSLVLVPIINLTLTIIELSLRLLLIDDNSFFEPINLIRSNPFKISWTANCFWLKNFILLFFKKLTVNMRLMSNLS